MQIAAYSTHLTSEPPDRRTSKVPRELDSANGNAMVISESWLTDPRGELKAATSTDDESLPSVLEN
jgi:hypothetical protein